MSSCEYSSVPHAWGTELYSQEDMSMMFQNIVDNVLLNGDGTNASHLEALDNFNSNSLNISLALPNAYGIEEIAISSIP